MHSMDCGFDVSFFTRTSGRGDVARDFDANSYQPWPSVSQATGSCVDGQSVAASHRGSNRPPTSTMRSHQRPFVESLRVIKEMGITLNARMTRRIEAVLVDLADPSDPEWVPPRATLR